jgi:hypothetical protein
LLVLDERVSSRVSVLCTAEPLSDWWRALGDSPYGELRPEDPEFKRRLNARIADASPFSPEGEEGYKRGWRCYSLLQAMYLMLWLDLTGGRFIRECELRDCHMYYREGSQREKTRYCSDQHTNLATSRRYLSKAP